jgi:hypothetical protein
MSDPSHKMMNLYIYIYSGVIHYLGDDHQLKIADKKYQLFFSGLSLPK